MCHLYAGHRQRSRRHPVDEEGDHRTSERRPGIADRGAGHSDRKAGVITAKSFFLRRRQCGPVS